jgi:hypothetical protein
MLFLRLSETGARAHTLCAGAQAIHRNPAAVAAFLELGSPSERERK